MPIFLTGMKVWDRVLNQFVSIEGQRIEAPTWQLAEEILIKEDLRWLKITGELIAEIPCKKNSFNPDWKNGIDYKKIQQN